MRWLAIIVVAIAIGAGIHGIWPDLFSHQTASASGPAKPAAREPNSLRRVFAAGTVEGTQRDVPLRFEITGRLKHVYVREGDRVETGDVLAALDCDAWEFKLAEALARLELARSERDRLVNGASPESREVARSDVRTAEVLVHEAESQHTRARQLSQRNAMSSQEFDEYRYKHEKAVAHLQAVRARWEEIEAPARQDDLAVAGAKVALAEAVVRQERNALEKTRLRAPGPGVILHVETEPGELVGPADAAPMITLVNRDSTRIRAFVEELDALGVVVGQKAFVTVDGKPRAAYEGAVKSCSPHVRPKTNRHHKPGEFVDLCVREVVIELIAGDDLVVGLPVDVFIEAEPAR
jgi:multidrug resistance efflux pump